MIRRTLALLLAASSLMPAHAAQEEYAEFRTPGEPLSLTPYIRWIAENPGETLKPEEAAARLRDTAPVDTQNEWLELSDHHAAVWLAIPIRNVTSEANLVLEYRNPRMNYVDCYQPRADGGYDVAQSGAARPFDLREIRYPMPVFPIEIAQGQDKTILLRLQNYGDYRQRIRLWDSTGFANQAVSAYLPDLLTMGMLLVLFIYQVLICITLRERSYFYLSIFVLSWMLFLLASTGLGKMLFWPNFLWIGFRANSLFISAMTASFIAFAMSYLDARRHMPWLYRLGLLFLCVNAAHLVYTIATDTLLRIILNRLLVAAAFAMVLALGIQGVRNGSSAARFFLVQWGWFILGGILLLLLNMYVLPAGWVLRVPIVNILFSISILLWSLDIIGRVKVRAEEQRRLLEAQVRERTQELEQALVEVKTLSGLLPICSSCKNIRDDNGYWNSVEQYLTRHTDADFTHGICPSCYDRLYPEIAHLRERRQEGGS